MQRSFVNNRLTTVEPSLFDRVMFVQELYGINSTSINALIFF